MPVDVFSSRGIGTRLHYITQGLRRLAKYFPSLDRVPRIEQHACQIEDPVLRLRYLRTVTARRPPWHRPHTLNLRALTPHLAWLALPLVMAISAPAPKSLADTASRERGLLAPGGDLDLRNLPVARVWRVDHSDSTDVYSNGLRVDLTFAVHNRPRARYPIYSLAGASRAVAEDNVPVGIVYHTTESLLAPFEEGENGRLQQLGRNLLEVTRTERAYHYVIDRFGRVFAVVAESDAANHVGNSIWADGRGIYVNLNDSFIGVSFEGQTDAPDDVNPAQIASAKVLTEMLRSRYHIAAEDCVTHAQVSVNPDNMRIGSHVDWASNFPFRAIGLPDNYSVPLPSVYAFGFKYDETFLRVTGDRWKGLQLAADQVERQAAAEGVPLAQYREILRHRYKDIAAALKQSAQEATTAQVVRDSKKTSEGGY